MESRRHLRPRHWRRFARNSRKQRPWLRIEIPKKEISELQEYYRTGDLKLWDQYNITWVNHTLGIVDFTNGFVEDYNDPLGRKAYWESVVNVKDSPLQPVPKC